jgi:hypothetical protein
LFGAAARVVSYSSILFACGHDASGLEVREDLAPITRRVTLGSAVRRVRWLARPEYEDSGCAPPTLDNPTHIYVWLPADAALATAALATAAPAPPLRVPEAVAEALLPRATWLAAARSHGFVELRATLMAPQPKVLLPGTTLTISVYLDGGSWLEMLEGGGS